MQKTTEVKEVEIETDNQIITSTVLITYLKEDDYGQDADGNRGVVRITIDDAEILEISAEDDNGNDLPITDEMKQRVLNNIGD